MRTYLTRNFDNPAARTIEGYEKAGGYQAARKALSLPPDAVIREVKDANLRGRGGAGFPAGIKWAFLPKDDRPRWLVVNADEGEPGTFKDRRLLENDPHQLLEGIVITSYAIRAGTAVIYVRGELEAAARCLESAIGEAKAKGYIGPTCFGGAHALDVIVHRGAGAYICGEETALLESLEGKRGEPRLRPPFPAMVGAFGNPTIINNVETTCAVPSIIAMGGKAYAELGVPMEGGTRIFCVSGHVLRPGLYELPVGTNLKSIIFDVAGGIRGGRALKAVFPGGSSTPVLRPEEIDVSCCIDGLHAAGSMIGSAAIVVMDDTTCMVRVAWRLARFYRNESCGQCTPCREGTWWLEQALTRIEYGTGTTEDIAIAVRACEGMLGTTICAFSDAAAMGVGSYLQKFREEFERHVSEGRCPFHSRFTSNWESS